MKCKNPQCASAHPNGLTGYCHDCNMAGVPELMAEIERLKSMFPVETSGELLIRELQAEIERLKAAARELLAEEQTMLSAVQQPALATVELRRWTRAAKALEELL